MEKQRITPRDFFLHLGIIVALYVSAVSIIALLFQIIDTTFPDTLMNYVDPYSSGIRFAIASLIIFFPVYILLGWLYNRDVRGTPEKKHIGIRRWLVYLTLFITGLTIVIDLVMLLNTFLGGEISTRFILKVIAVLIIAGIIFAYYILNLRGVTSRKNIFRWFVGGSIVLVILVLAWGFYTMGSPSSQRAKRFDLERVSALQGIQYQVSSYWQDNQKLPASLDMLNDSLDARGIARDPETNQAYEYQPVSNTSFKLCATFSLAGNNSYTTPVGAEDNWQHQAGHTCFARSINPELYPPTPTPVAPVKR
jgi:hypothetical protein